MIKNVEIKMSLRIQTGPHLSLRVSERESGERERETERRDSRLGVTRSTQRQGPISKHAEFCAKKKHKNVVMGLDGARNQE